MALVVLAPAALAQKHVAVSVTSATEEAWSRSLLTSTALELVNTKQDDVSTSKMNVKGLALPGVYLKARRLRFLVFRN